MDIQTIVQERNKASIQLAQAHTHAGEIREQVERLGAMAAQVAVDIRNLEATVAGLNVALQVLEQQPADAPATEQTT